VTTSQNLKIVNEKGLHARASAKFVETVESYEGAAMVSRDGMRVSGDSIMGLLMLGAHKGTFIEVETSGPQAGELLSALQDLVANRFGEEF